MNDSYRTDVLLLYPPHIIALACIYLVAFQKDKDVSQWFSELNVEMKEVRRGNNYMRGIVLKNYI